MTELSLNILDIVENSIRANATLIEIKININTQQDQLTISIKDNGDGMSDAMLMHVDDPFYTTRTTRNVGLGIPFFKQAAIMTGGSFSITSKQSEGTEVNAAFGLSHIDRMPIGNMTSTIYTLLTLHTETDFLYTYSFNKALFTLDTRQIRKLIGDVPINSPQVLNFLTDYLNEKTNSMNKGSEL